MLTPRAGRIAIVMACAPFPRRAMRARAAARPQAQVLCPAAPPAPNPQCGRTALHEASEKGHVAIVQLLLERGASATAKTHDGRTVLHLAAELPGAVALAKLALQRCAGNAKNFVDAAEEKVRGRRKGVTEAGCAAFIRSHACACAQCVHAYTHPPTRTHTHALTRTHPHARTLSHTSSTSTRPCTLLQSSARATLPSCS